MSGLSRLRPPFTRLALCSAKALQRPCFNARRPSGAVLFGAIRTFTSLLRPCRLRCLVVHQGDKNKTKYRKAVISISTGFRHLWYTGLIRTLCRPERREVAGRSDSVAVLPGWTRQGGSWTASSNVTQLAAAQLGALIGDLERSSPEFDWSPRRWKIVSTSWRMRICILRNTLREMVLSSPVGERSAIRWVLEVDAVSREIERQSDEVTARIQVLQRSNAGVAGRERDLEKLLAGRRELIGVLGLARNLISQRVSPSREVRTVTAYGDLLRTLRSFDEDLRVMVQRYEEAPRSLDEALENAMGNVVNPEKLVVELHRMMMTAVFAEHSPLRANANLWEAFMQQQEEFSFLQVRLQCSRNLCRGPAGVLDAQAPGRKGAAAW